ncbi:MAG: hypothetical protein COV69_02345 [Parcubacteria group bacterium CG11_big_fil_rev_8_21_14_0_20_39_14]|nr:MAG: hypothetical protein COV69_02345 [Parcubacteria group bacterium CG11_big_fil_rev_8_21_14_0_20_39_14]PIS35422.1 MAG: hypothetical protein COT36_02500 [Parcubacteria group bacterium CG08_land_8_20_14_0_20_38_56]
MGELTLLQKQVLKLFAKSSLRKDFYWTGGTLLSFLYLHHRKSQDLDFFSDKPFNYNEVIAFIGGLKKQLNLPKVEEKKIFDRWEFFLHNKGKLRLEFVLYEHPKLKPRKKWKEIWIDSLDDIAANKLMAFFDRNDPKDLVDLYFLLTEKKYKIKHLLKLMGKKFGVEIPESAVWSEAYKGMDELDNLRPLLSGTKSEKQKLLREIKDYFSNHSSEYLRKILK